MTDLTIKLAESANYLGDMDLISIHDWLRDFHKLHVGISSNEMCTTFYYFIRNEMSPAFIDYHCCFESGIQRALTKIINQDL